MLSLDQKRRGFTLTELAIVLGIVGLILSAIWVASSKVSQNNRVQKAAGQAMTILTGYKAIYGTRGLDFSGCNWDDITSLGVNSGVFPADALVGTQPTNPWNGNIVVQACGTNNTILVSFGGLSQNACNGLANALYGNPDAVYESINDGSSWHSQWLAPFATNASWTATTINGFCANNNNNIVQVGIQVR